MLKLKYGVVVDRYFGSQLRWALRLLRALLLFLVALTAGAPAVRAQVPTDTELEALNKRALALYQAGRYDEAIPLAERYATAMKVAYGEDAPQYSVAINNLAAFLRGANRLAEAEPLIRRALANEEKAFGPDHPNVAIDLGNLALLLKATNRFAEAEPLMRRALAIDEKARGPNHPAVANALNNLAQILVNTNRRAEAEPLYRQALAINEKMYGPDHPVVANVLNNLAALFVNTNRLAEAEPLMRRVLVIDEKAHGPDHPTLAIHLNNLAGLLQKTNRFAEAEALMRRALAIDEKVYGSDHPNVAIRLNNLAGMRAEQNDWAGSAALCLRAKPIMTNVGASTDTESQILIKAELTRNTAYLRACAVAHFRANSASNLGEGFILAQWALQNTAADALNAMSLRFAKGDAQLAPIVRTQQDLLNARAAAFRQLYAAVGKADAKATGAARTAIAKIEAQYATGQTALRRDFPDYAALASSQTLMIAEAQALIGEEQALVLFLDMWQMDKVPGETLVFVLTRHEARWLRVPLDTRALQARVTALRCGLDSSNWGPGQKRRDICRTLLNTEATETELPPFDAQLAHTLYRDLFGGVKISLRTNRC